MMNSIAYYVAGAYFAFGAYLSYTLLQDRQDERKAYIVFSITAFAMWPMYLTLGIIHAKTEVFS